ncbi:hypothetical protein ACH518_12025 [Methylomonas sp. HW2-6]|uniref:hypothetical protein n=1 Tax=Methylomonas sp. HW2-6 TaxID=3376687 RepID=UPI004040F549
MNSVWEKAIKAEKVNTPKKFLDEIGEELFSKSSYVVRGNAIRLDEGDQHSFTYRFIIVSDRLQYSYNLFNIVHGIELYPVCIKTEEMIITQADIKGKIDTIDVNGFNVRGIICNDETDFKNTIIKIIQTDRVVKIIQSIISQSE